jgi:iron complex transport system substrate-binding protein
MFKESVYKIRRMEHRIVSFLPSATEILYELGVGDQVLAVTHECNYPSEAKTKPRAINSVFNPKKMTSKEIDSKVVELVQAKKDIYVLDEQVLKKANPDLIVAQGICEVCSPYINEINRAVSILQGKPEVLILDPQSLGDILDTIIELGKKVEKLGEAQAFVHDLRARIKIIQHRQKIVRPQVLCIEWLDPLFTAGHWVPQMVELAGGINGISATGDRSRRMELDEIVKFDPDIIVLMPCGFDVTRTMQEYEKLTDKEKWRSLKAVKQGQVYAVHANEYFSKPGPRTVIGLEILAKIINPDTFKDLQIPKNSIQKIEFEL